MEVLLTPQQGTPMSEMTVIGLDLAKHVFQVHGADPDGRPVLRKRLRRCAGIAASSASLLRKDCPAPAT
jgi:hypothetical protein